MKVYPSDIRDWSAELNGSMKSVKPSHPYDQESTDSAWWMYMFFAVVWIVRIILKLIF